MKTLKTFLMLFLSTLAFGQKETAHWYFGGGTGLDFTSGKPVVDLAGSLYTDEGCSSISDKQGNLLFYTDGVFVYNRQHTTMSNGYGLLGNSTSTQSGIIVPDPYHNNLFYVFTVDANDENPDSIKGLHYSVVDMTLASGLGGIVTTQKNIPLPLNGIQKSSEKITAVKHANGKDIWVITHFLDSFYAFLVNNTGVVSTPVVSKVGVTIPFKIKDKLVYPNNARGYIKVSPNGKKIVIAHLSNVGDSDYSSLPNPYVANCATVYSHGGVLGLYDFNDNTGIVSNEVILSDQDKKAFYGVEFSPSSKILYAEYDLFQGITESCNYTELDMDWKEGRLVQFDLAAPDIPGTENILYTFPTDVKKFNSARGALQLGLDRKIYYTNFTSNYISVINKPDVLGTGAQFTPKAIYLEGRITKYGLPPFITSFFEGNIIVNGSIHTSDICENKEVNFSLKTDLDSGYTLDWNFGDGSPVVTNNSVPVHIYATPGTYTVTVTMHYRGEDSTFTKTITVYSQPVVNLGADVNQCGGEVTLDAGNPGSTYLWNTGETTQTISVTTSGTYSVTVANTGGCQVTDEIKVSISQGLVVDLGPDIEQCEGKVILNAGNSGSTYLWSTGETTQTIEVASSGVYSVVVTSSYGCEGIDEIKVDLIQKPIVSLGTDINQCGGEVTLDAGNPGSTYLWSTGETTQTITVTISGTYSVTVTNAEGCSTTAEVNVNITDQPYVTNVKINGNTIEIIAEGSGSLEYSLDSVTWQSSPVFSNLIIGMHKAYVRSVHGCISDPHPFGLLDIPNTITPNGDGINDVWNLADPKSYSGSRIKIFNRYGRMLMDKVFTDNPVWDGKYSGSIVPSTNYWYSIELTNGQRLTGWLLVRAYNENR